MRLFMIVEPDEAVSSAGALAERPAPLQRQASVIDGAEEPLDLAIRLRMTRPEQVMRDVQALTGLLESGEAVMVLGNTAS